MTRPLTPGAYLKYRRTAAGLALVDVAARLETTPRLAEHVLAHQLELIEADIAPARFETIAALRCAYRFNLDVLATLALIHLGASLAVPWLCRICASSDTSVSARAWGAPDLCLSCARHLGPHPVAA